METQKYLKKEEFKLEKFKIDKDDLLVNFVEQRQTNEGVVKIPVSMQPPFQPHPDLTDLLKSLKDYVLQQYGYKTLLDAAPKDKELREAYNELLSNTTVTGFTMAGSDQLRAAIITAKVKTESGTRALPTGRIVFSSEKLGYEQEVEVIIGELEEEVYACLFENKRAQLDLFQEEPETAETALGLVS